MSKRNYREFNIHFSYSRQFFTWIFRYLSSFFRHFIGRNKPFVSISWWRQNNTYISYNDVLRTRLLFKCFWVILSGNTWQQVLWVNLECREPTRFWFRKNIDQGNQPINYCGRQLGIYVYNPNILFSFIFNQRIFFRFHYF